MITEMKATLRTTIKPKGVGLAAPQVGLPYRMFITRPTEKSEIRVFINPEIILCSEDLTEGVPERENKLEGCLSIPNLWGQVKRAATLTLKYTDEKGVTHEEKFSGFMATIIQHETDHVNGILFAQRVLEQKGKFYKTVVNKDKKEVLEEVSI